MSSEWWNPYGDFKPLHSMNTLRWVLASWTSWNIVLNSNDHIKMVDMFENLYISNDLLFFRVELIRNGLMNNRQIETINTEFPLQGLTILDIGCGGGILSQVFVLWILFKKNHSLNKIHQHVFCVIATGKTGSYSNWNRCWKRKHTDGSKKFTSRVNPKC